MSYKEKIKAIIGIVNNVTYDGTDLIIDKDYSEYLINLFGGDLRFNKVLSEIVESNPDIFSMYGLSIKQSTRSLYYNGKYIYFYE